jgi:uncharacterized membrane protein
VSSLYLWLKWTHIVSSTVLLGTGAGIAFFFMRAQRSGDPRVIAAMSHRLLLAAGVLVSFHLMIAKPGIWG